MTRIVDGRKIASEILEGLRTKIKTLGLKPRLAVIQVGDDPASSSYVKMKKKMGEAVGLWVDLKNYPKNISQDELIAAIAASNSDPRIHGILVQLPLPSHLTRAVVLNSVVPAKDVDCLTSTNKEALVSADPVFLPPAAAAVMKILDYYKIELINKNILLVGSGDLVGQPLGEIFSKKSIPFKIANRHTGNLSELAASADIIITGAGQPGLVTGEMVKSGAVVIDAGTTGSDEGAVVGDVEYESVSKKAMLLYPAPGGVGPVTVALLLPTVVNSAVQNQNMI